MISIIVPVYNVAPYLPQCLDSLVNQTYRDLEIICVNDGSTDGSLAILKEYAKVDERIKIISRENRGISCSRNEALDIVQGEWTMFVDSDDWIDSNTCESALNLALQHQADVIMWAYMREYRNQSLPKYYIPEATIWEGENISQLHRRIVGPINEELSRPDTMDAWGTIWGKLYRSSFIHQDSPIRFVDTKVIGSVEDVLFNIAYMGRISKAVYVPETWYHYRKGESYTSSHKADLPQKWELLYLEIEKELTKQQLGTDFIQAYKNRISIGIIGLGLNEMFAKTSLKGKYKRIQALLNRKIYQKAIRNLSLRYFPIHWKVFFKAAKINSPFCITLMLLTIQKLTER
ncbi:MAG: glycosyltransferase family 2 protein [Bacteroides sp.]|nr:glycosyltransferase family 2 protein [Bacteroides sp.]